MFSSGFSISFAIPVLIHNNNDDLYDFYFFIAYMKAPNSTCFILISSTLNSCWISFFISFSLCS